MKLQHDSPHHPDPIHPDDFGGDVRAKTSNLIFLARHIYWSYIRISAVQPVDCRRVPECTCRKFRQFTFPFKRAIGSPHLLVMSLAQDDFDNRDVYTFFSMSLALSLFPSSSMESSMICAPTTVRPLCDDAFTLVL